MRSPPVVRGAGADTLGRPIVDFLTHLCPVGAGWVTSQLVPRYPENWLPWGSLLYPLRSRAVSPLWLMAYF